MNIIYKPYMMILSVILILNITFFAVSYFYGLQRSLINIDYMIIFLFAYYKNRVNDIFLFLILFCIFFIDVLLLVLQIFPFVQLNDLMYLSTFILRSPALYKFSPLFCFVFLCVVFYFVKEFVFNKFILLKK